MIVYLLRIEQLGLVQALPLRNKAMLLGFRVTLPSNYLLWMYQDRKHPTALLLRTLCDVPYASPKTKSYRVDYRIEIP
jgi:hypothetical protein